MHGALYNPYKVRLTCGKVLDAHINQVGDMFQIYPISDTALRFQVPFCHLCIISALPVSLDNTKLFQGVPPTPADMFSAQGEDSRYILPMGGRPDYYTILTNTRFHETFNKVRVIVESLTDGQLPTTIQGIKELLDAVTAQYGLTMLKFCEILIKARFGKGQVDISDSQVIPMALSPQ